MLIPNVPAPQGRLGWAYPTHSAGAGVVSPQAPVYHADALVPGAAFEVQHQPEPLPRQQPYLPRVGNKIWVQHQQRTPPVAAPVGAAVEPLPDVHAAQSWLRLGYEMGMLQEDRIGELATAFQSGRQASELAARAGFERVDAFWRAPS